MIDSIYTAKLDKVLQHLTDDLKSVKTGRAKPSLVENISVEAYESQMTLKELASISAPDARQIVISPWDKTITKEIAKAINSTDLNLNAVVDSDLVRINIPQLTTETREELVKLVKQKVESVKIMIRQVRAEAKKEIEGQKDRGGVSEDEIKRQIEELQKTIDEHEELVEDFGKTKEKELMTI